MGEFRRAWPRLSSNRSKVRALDRHGERLSRPRSERVVKAFLQLAEQYRCENRWLGSVVAAKIPKRDVTQRFGAGRLIELGETYDSACAGDSVGNDRLTLLAPARS